MSILWWALKREREQKKRTCWAGISLFIGLISNANIDADIGWWSFGGEYLCNIKYRLMLLSVDYRWKYLMQISVWCSLSGRIYQCKNSMQIYIGRCCYLVEYIDADINLHIYAVSCLGWIPMVIFDADIIGLCCYLGCEYISMQAHIYGDIGIMQIYIREMQIYIRVCGLEIYIERDKTVFWVVRSKCVVQWGNINTNANKYC